MIDKEATRFIIDSIRARAVHAKDLMERRAKYDVVLDTLHRDIEFLCSLIEEIINGS